MSYIAVSLKAIEVQGPALSRALNLELALVVGRLNLLWHRCWSMKTDRVGALELRGFFPEPEAGPLLEAYGFLAKDAEGWRVKGADRYLRLREQRTAAGKARSSSAGRSAGKFTSKTPANNQRSTSGQPALTPSTEHRAPNTEVTTSVAVATELALEIQPSPDTRTETEKLKDALTDDEFDVFAEWAQLYRPKAVPTVERRKLIAKWLKVYSVEQLQCAIRGVQRSPHHMGHNDRRTKYDGLELILRDAEHIEKFMRLTEEAA